MNNEIKELKKKISSFNHKINSLTKKISPYLKEIERLQLKANKASIKIQDIELEKQMNTDDWNYWLFENGRVNGKRYKTRAEKINKLGLMLGGYFPETKQSAVRICIDRTKQDSLEKTKNALNIIIPYIKPLSDGKKHLSIFEHTLSQIGSYNLLIGDKFELTITRFSRPTVLKTFDTLQESLEYIKENHYYESTTQ